MFLKGKTFHTHLANAYYLYNVHNIMTKHLKESIFVYISYNSILFFSILLYGSFNKVCLSL